MINVGDLVIDIGTNCLGMVIRKNPEFPDGEGGFMSFDLEILEGGSVYCVDLEDVKAFT